MKPAYIYLITTLIILGVLIYQKFHPKPPEPVKYTMQDVYDMAMKDVDYLIDIHDNGTGTIQLYEVSTKTEYQIPFDSLEATILKLNE